MKTISLKNQKLSVACLALLTLINLPVPSLAASGGNSGGGGKGVVCRDSQGKQTVELLDLWEAKHIFNRKIIYSDLPVEQQVEQAFENLQNAFYHDDQDMPLIEMHTSALPFFNKGPDVVTRLTGVELSNTPDSYEQARPVNCEIKQIVIYNDKTYPKIIMNQDLFEQLDKTNQAALILHESVYKYLRDHSREENSIRARRSVGLVLSGYHFESIRSYLPKDKVLCRDKNYNNVIYVYLYGATNNQQLYTQAVRLSGKDLIGFEQGSASAAQEKSLENYLYHSKLQPHFIYADQVGPFSQVDDGFDRPFFVTKRKTNGKLEFYLDLPKTELKCF